YEPDNEYHGTSAALEFAVTALEVKNIIVMGHARCGGINALVNRDAQATTDFIASWMRIAEPALAQVAKLAPPPDQLQRTAEQEAVKVSLANLMTFPWVRSRVESGALKLHGWYFDLETATLHIMDEAGTFAPAP